MAHTHWIGPNIGIAVFSAGTTIRTHCQTAYVIDAYPDHTVSALAAIAAMKDFAGFWVSIVCFADVQGI